MDIHTAFSTIGTTDTPYPLDGDMFLPYVLDEPLPLVPRAERAPRGMTQFMLKDDKRPKGYAEPHNQPIMACYTRGIDTPYPLDTYGMFTSIVLNDALIGVLDDPLPLSFIPYGLRLNLNDASDTHDVTDIPVRLQNTLDVE